MEWISVENELPTPDMPMLCESYGTIYIASMIDEEPYNEHWIICEDKCCSCTGLTAPITHWMPLPEPPKE